MKIKMMIATTDNDYAKLLSDNISEFHSNKIDVSECSGVDGFNEAGPKRKYDVALVDSKSVGKADLTNVTLPILLWSDNDASEITEAISFGINKIRKYQRITSIIAGVFEYFAKVSETGSGPESKHTEITAVWSPVGGVGKTTTALAYAASKVAEGKEVFYLNFEDFSSIPGYFHETGKSISSVFEMLDTQTGNIKMFIQGICCLNNGIKYLSGPDNYEDMYILTLENISELITACAGLTDELILDLPCVYDARTKKSFEAACNIFIVTSPEYSADAKLIQFKSQNNVYEDIKDKVTFIMNKATPMTNESLSKPDAGLKVISLPYIKTENARDVYKSLAMTGFRS